MMMGDGVSGMLEFCGAEERRGHLWNLANFSAPSYRPPQARANPVLSVPTPPNGSLQFGKDL